MALFQMDFFVYALIIILVIGGVLVLMASLGFIKNAEEDKEELVDLSQKLDVLEHSVSEADEVINELNDMSKNVLKEFEGKYQELLFLYNLIDEKQKNIEIEDTPIRVRQLSQAEGLEEYAKKVDIVIDDSNKIGINPKFANVIELYRGGKSIEEIAKQLNMGKGEVGLILTFGGALKNA